MHRSHVKTFQTGNLVVGPGGYKLVSGYKLSSEFLGSASYRLTAHDIQPVFQ